MIHILLLAAVALDCHTVAGDRILGSDLAAASPVFSAIAPDAAIGNAPQPGARRIFEIDELARIVRAQGLTGVPAGSLCFERFAAPLDPVLVHAAIEKSLAIPEAELTILEVSKFAVPRGELVFPREALPQPGTGDSGMWSGYVAYTGGRFPIWASVRIHVKTRHLVAAHDLTPGHPLAPEDVRVEEAADFPRRVLPLDSADAAIGRVVRRSMRAGTPLMALDLTEPEAVERGQTVSVEVRSGAAVLRLEATAEMSGHRGDTISLRNLASGKIFRARIEERGRAIVDLPPSEVEIAQ
jgi:flagella basal body P-ring formation protein FlgA